MPSQANTPREAPLIGALLRSGWQAVRARIQRDLSADGFDDIALAHLAVFQYPSPRGVRVTTLAERAGMSRQAINYLIRELEERGYLERRPSTEDRRARLVHLTDRGEAAIRSIRASVKQVEREWERELGRGRFAELRATLIDVAALADQQAKADAQDAIGIRESGDAAP
jgi:DNA-binding MarR family transcriptional regulator